VRGQAQDFDTWAQMGNRGWRHAEILLFFKRMESYAGEGDAAFRGRRGPLRVTNPEPRDPAFATIIKAAAEIGIRHGEIVVRAPDGDLGADAVIEGARETAAAPFEVGEDGPLGAQHDYNTVHPPFPARLSLAPTVHPFSTHRVSGLTGPTPGTPERLVQILPLDSFCKTLRFFADGAAKKWPLARGSLKEARGRA